MRRPITVAITWAAAYLISAASAAAANSGADTGFIAAIVAAVLSFVSAIAVALIQVRHSRKSDDNTGGDPALIAVLEALHSAEVDAAVARRDADEASEDRDEQAALVRHLYGELEELRAERRPEGES